MLFRRLDERVVSHTETQGLMGGVQTGHNDVTVAPHTQLSEIEQILMSLISPQTRVTFSPGAVLE